MTGQEVLIYSPSGDCSAFWEKKAAESKWIQHTVMSVFIIEAWHFSPALQRAVIWVVKQEVCHKVSHTAGRAVCRGGLTSAWRDFMVSPPHSPPATRALLPSRFTC